MQQVDVLVVGNGACAITVVDHAAALKLSTLVASAEPIAETDARAIHEMYGGASLTLDPKARVLHIKSPTVNKKVRFISMIIAMEPTIVASADEEPATGCFVDSTCDCQEASTLRPDAAAMDACMQISLIRNRCINVRTNSMLQVCNPLFIAYLQNIANIKFSFRSSEHAAHDKKAESKPGNCVLVPVDPLVKASIAIDPESKSRLSLHIKKYSAYRKSSFLETSVPRIYVISIDYPVLQQADDIMRRQVFPFHFWQRKTLQPRMCVEYSPGRKLYLYGQQLRELERKHGTHVVVRIPLPRDSSHAAEVYFSQLGVVLGFALFLPESDSLVVPLTLSCDQKLSIVHFTSACGNSSLEDNTSQDTLLRDIILEYYRNILDDQAVSKIMHIAFKYRHVVIALFCLSPLLVLLAFVACAVLIF